MVSWHNALLEKFRHFIEKRVPIGELTDENYITYFRQLFILIASILGFILCTFSFYTQKDEGFLNFVGLAIIDVAMVINYLLILQQKEVIAARLFILSLIVGVALGAFDDSYFLSSAFIWFLIFPFFMFILLDKRDFYFFQFVNFLGYLLLQLHFYPSKEDILPFQGGVSARLYWKIENIEFITALISVMLIIGIYSYARSFLQERFKRYQEKLVQTSKLSALGEMAGGIGHEINNPLAVVKVGAHALKRLIEQEELNKDKIKENVDIINETVIRISRIIDSLKMMTRQQEVKDEVINVKNVIENVLEISHIHLHQEEIELTKSVDDSLVIFGSSIQLSQILLNLLNNAIYAAKSQSPALVSLQCYKSGQDCMIQVSDNGKGVPEEIVNKIFEPFFTSKPIGEGTGLGLSLCRSMAQAMGGDIEYSREEGMTTFTVILPVVS